MNCVNLITATTVPHKTDKWYGTLAVYNKYIGFNVSFMWKICQCSPKQTW